MSLVVVILCGGSGTRLWPLSRENLPKQFLKLTDKNYTMFQLTCLRAQKLQFDQLIVICNEQHIFLAQEQLDHLGFTGYRIFGEPFGKNTAACVALSCLLTDPNDQILILSSDHIFNDEMFASCVQQGRNLAGSSIVVFGVQPTSPETGYGYLNYEGDRLLRFVEKPNKETAIEYLQSGNYLWNSGNFLFTNQPMTQELVTHAPDIYEAMKTTLHHSEERFAVSRLNPEMFSLVRSESIDYAVMEHCQHGRIVKYFGYWNDIGSFSSLYDHLNKDESGNVIEGDVKCMDTHNSLIRSESGLVTTLGVNNLIVINMRDAIFIADKARSQDIKLLIKECKDEHRSEAISHALTFHPWGHTLNLEELEGCILRKICVYPNKSFPVQVHSDRAVHWLFLHGSAQVQLGQDLHFLTRNQSIYFPSTLAFQLENVGTTLVEFLETQILQLGQD